MRFGIRWARLDAEGGEGAGAGGAATTEDPGAADAPKEPAAPELTPFQKKLAGMRQDLKKGDDAAGGETPEGEGEAATDDKAKADDGSPGPKRTPKKPDAKDEKPEPKAKTDDKAKPDAKAKADEPEPLKLSLPHREPGQADVEFVIPRKALEDAGVDVKEFEARMTQMRKGFLRYQDLLPAKEEIAAQRAELEEFEAELREDPVSFIAERIEKPELHEQIVERLLTMLPQEAFDRVLTKADQMEKDPTKRENARLRAQVAQQDRAADRRAKADEKKTDLGGAKKIGEQISGLMEDVGLDADDPKAARFFDYAIASLVRHVEKNKLDSLDPSTVPELLAELGVLEDFGLERKAEKPKAPAKSKAAGKSPAAGGDAVPQDPRERDKRRREATTTPSGDGAPAAAGDRLPKGGTFRQKMDGLRSHLGLPKKS